LQRGEKGSPMVKIPAKRQRKDITKVPESQIGSNIMRDRVTSAAFPRGKREKQFGEKGSPFNLGTRGWGARIERDQKIKSIYFLRTMRQLEESRTGETKGGVQRVKTATEDIRKGRGNVPVRPGRSAERGGPGFRGGLEGPHSTKGERPFALETKGPHPPKKNRAATQNGEGLTFRGNWGPKGRGRGLKKKRGGQRVDQTLMEEEKR